METATLITLNKLVTTMHWREELIEAETEDATDLAILSVLDYYAVELRYRLGVHTPYSGSDQLHRLATLRGLLRTIDPIIDLMGRKANGQHLPNAARLFCTFLYEIALDLSQVIIAIEKSHPDLTDLFQMQRESYANRVLATAWLPAVNSLSTTTVTPLRNSNAF